MKSSPRPRTADVTLRWFPLIPRPRPPCLPLDTRISQLTQLAAEPDSKNPVSQAAEVLNKAALIASDCGLPDLAHALCWRQHEVFNQARPLAGQTARLALQPLLNIPRQLIRDGKGDTACALLKALHHAARDHSDTVICGRTVSFHGMVRDPEDHKAIQTLIWTALLADGTRALIQADRWQQAADMTAAHRGVGYRLLDGRQVTILALAHNGDYGQAIAMIEHSTIVEPWERVIQHLLRVLCQRDKPIDIEPYIMAMLEAALTLLQQHDSATAVFRVRVGLTAAGLAPAGQDSQQAQLSEQLIGTASIDANAAIDVLTHPALRDLTTNVQRQSLARVVDAAGLHAGSIPEQLYADMIAAVSLAEDRLKALLLPAEN